MNLPNKLTILRVLLVPVYCVLYLYGLKIPALIVFALASFTDLLDGKIARSTHQVTDFGKFMDPLADKLLVGSAMICFVQDGAVAAWVVVILIGREFVISGFRLVAATKGIVIAADIWGKIKTVVQMAAIVALLLPIEAQWFYILCQVLVYASVALTLISVGNYILSNPGVLRESEDK
ncbi:MAG: CDP-diacylglycerol--glycerol-3-phosphate 3-phosphatidyltransferase [Firmicutes bacterium]|nr:CDP-diacylglycerol--glycerol-3-phosphate 3-phosphatidyltransferase [Bacillota bacterium]